jgi:hypothetical protein
VVESYFQGVAVVKCVKSGRIVVYRDIMLA